MQIESKLRPIMFVCHFVDTDLGVEKDEPTEYRNIDFGVWGTCCTLTLGVQENFKQSLIVT